MMHHYFGPILSRRRVARNSKKVEGQNGMAEEENEMKTKILLDNYYSVCSVVYYNIILLNINLVCTIFYIVTTRPLKFEKNDM